MEFMYFELEKRGKFRCWLRGIQEYCCGSFLNKFGYYE